MIDTLPSAAPIPSIHLTSSTSSSSSSDTDRRVETHTLLVPLHHSHSPTSIHFVFPYLLAHRTALAARLTHFIPSSVLTSVRELLFSRFTTAVCSRSLSLRSLLLLSFASR